MRLLNLLVFMWSVVCRCFKVGCRCLCNVSVMEMWRVVGMMLLEDWLRLMLLFGCSGVFELMGFLESWFVWLVMILFVFMLVEVLEFVWKILMGKCLISFFCNNLCVICWINVFFLVFRRLSLVLVVVYVSFMRLRLWMNVGGIGWLLMGKFKIVCWVEVLYKVFLGIGILFMELCLVCMFGL